jgi:hypothetical protein
MRLRRKPPKYSVITEGLLYIESARPRSLFSAADTHFLFDAANRSQRGTQGEADAGIRANKWTGILSIECAGASKLYCISPGFSKIKPPGGS